MSNLEIKLIEELRNIGVLIDDIYDLVNLQINYDDAVPVLLSSLEQENIDDLTKEGIIRALAVKASKGIANKKLIALYLKTPNDKMLLKWAIGNTIYEIVDNDDLEDILKIVRNAENGMSRQMFVLALSKMENTEDVLIELLSDDEIAAHAISSLGKLKATKAIDKIKKLSSHPNQLIKKEAIKTIKMLDNK